MTPRKPIVEQRVDFWQQRGASDAAIRLMTSGLVRPGVTYKDVCRAMGITDRAAVDAVTRYKARTRPKRKRHNQPHDPPAGTKWCGYAGHFPPLEDFAPNRSSTTGYQSWCRGCNVEARQEQRKRGRAA